MARRKKVSGRSRESASVASFLVELIVYAAFVFAYFFLVLHFLGGWLKHIFDGNKPLYAAVALALIVAQGVLLEMLTTALLKLVRYKVD